MANNPRRIWPPFGVIKHEPVPPAPLTYYSEPLTRFYCWGGDDEILTVEAEKVRYRGYDGFFVRTPHPSGWQIVPLAEAVRAAEVETADRLDDPVELDMIDGVLVPMEKAR